MWGPSAVEADGNETSTASFDNVNPIREGTSTSSNKKNPIALDKCLRIFSKGISGSNPQDSSSIRIVSSNKVKDSCQLYDGSSGSVPIGWGIPNQSFWME